uniref:ARID domain-containing protein n=1 Tax=Strigamia maritima TaxID=126957 RepID=T1IIW8_STRMM
MRAWKWDGIAYDHISHLGIYLVYSFVLVEILAVCQEFFDLIKRERIINMAIRNVNKKCDQVPSVTVLSYPRYCRYRAIQKRLESSSEQEHWLNNNYVHILGGFPPKSKPHLVLFCRDTVDRPDLEQHDQFRVNLMPSLKGRPRKRRLKCFGGEKSPSSESYTSEESKEIKERNNNRLMVKIDRCNLVKTRSIDYDITRNAVHYVLLLKSQMKNVRNAAEIREEEDFLEDLFAFMKDRKTPIERVPHLGFKQINLYLFYSYAQNLGGYEKITSKKLWKQIYDVLGGSPGSTSAATCTRRHYERLLLSYERHMKGEEYKPLPIPLRHKRPLSITKRQPSSPTPPPHPMLIPEIQSQSDVSPTETSGVFSVSSVASPTESSLTSPGDRDDTSPNVPMDEENGPKQGENSSPLTPCDIRCDTPPATPPTVYEENHELMTPCLKEEQWEERRRKSTHPKQRLKDENFAAKERQWDEIRRLNAIERDKVRHMSHSMRVSHTQKKLKDSKHNLAELSPVPFDEPLSKEIKPEMHQISKEKEPIVMTSSDVFSPTALKPMYEVPVSSSNSQPPLADLSRVVNALPNPAETKSVSLSNKLFSSTNQTVDKKDKEMLIGRHEMNYSTPKIDKLHAIDEINSFTSPSTLPYLNLNKQNGEHIEKEMPSRHYSGPIANCSPISPQNLVARPSVIQHTTPFNRGVPKKESVYGAPIGNLSHCVSAVPSPIPTSDQLPSYYSQCYSQAHKKARFEPHHMISSTQYYSAPKMFDNPQDTLNLAPSSISSRTSHISNQSTTSSLFIEDEVLDLSMKKTKKEEEVKPSVHYIEDVAQYERITPPDKELDLSVKAKFTSSEPNIPSSHSSTYFPAASFAGSESVLAPPIRTSGVKEYNYVDSNRGLSTVVSSKLNSNDSLRTEQKLEKGPNSNSNQSCLTVSCVPLVPKQSFYSHQMTPNYYPSSMYAFSSPFMVPPASPYVSSDHLHASITAYKDMFHPNFYSNSGSYPYPPAPPLYHHLYKENQPSYLYPPK